MADSKGENKDKDLLDESIFNITLASKAKEFSSIAKLTKVFLKGEYKNDLQMWENALFRAFICKNLEHFGPNVFEVLEDLNNNDDGMQYEKLYRNIKNRLQDETDNVNKVTDILIALCTKKGDSDPGVRTLNKLVWDSSAEIIDIFKKFLLSLKIQESLLPDSNAVTELKSVICEINGIFSLWKIPGYCNGSANLNEELVNENTVVSGTCNKNETSTSPRKSNILNNLSIDLNKTKSLYNDNNLDIYDKIGYKPNRNMSELNQAGQQIFEQYGMCRSSDSSNADILKKKKSDISHLKLKNVEKKHSSEEKIQNKTQRTEHMRGFPTHIIRDVVKNKFLNAQGSDPIINIGRVYNINVYKELNSIQKMFITKSKNGFLCNLCCTFMNNEDLLKYHIYGRNHLKRQYETLNVKPNVKDKTASINSSAPLTKKQPKKVKVKNLKNKEEDLEIENERKALGIQIEILSQKYCKYCKLPIAGLKAVKLHVADKSHIANCKQPLQRKQKKEKDGKNCPLDKASIEQAIGNQVAFIDSKGNEFQCMLCKCGVGGSTLEGIKLHVNGNKHRKMYQKASIGNQCDKSIDKSCKSNKTDASKKPEKLLEEHCNPSLFLELAIKGHSVYIARVKSSVYFCWLCGVEITSIGNVIEHTRGKSHMNAYKKKKASV